MAASPTRGPVNIRGISLLTRPVETHHSLKKLRIIHITGRQKHIQTSQVLCALPFSLRKLKKKRKKLSVVIISLL